ncbi:MAG: glycosyltransferase [Lachnospiraceae bacterium]|nr:glycosyltransferase [Lachnospiraceae bacterium]
MDKVSIIVPVYNNEEYIGRCIRSLLRQTYHNLEILVINDGSTDSSGDIIEKLQKKDDRIRLFHQMNQGVAAARNKGLDEAMGEYITFVDGDDYVGRNYIEDLHRCAVENQAEMVICGLTFAAEDGKILRRLIPDTYERFRKEEWTFKISAVCSHFYKRELWDRYGIRFVSGERGEDMPISLTFSALCQEIAVLPKADYYYIQHASSAMHNFRGLKNYNLPYHSLEEAIRKITHYGCANGYDFYELFVWRILATCYFDLARGADANKMSKLDRYIYRIITRYFPNYSSNKKLNLFSTVRVPISQKAAVSLLRFLVKFRLLGAFSKIISRLK